MPESLGRVSSLPVAQGVLLWCMRMWVIDMKRGIGAEPRIAAMLDELGVAAAGPPLKTFMKTLSREATRMIDFQCVCAVDVGVDESSVLRVMSLAQSLRSWEALHALRKFTSAAGSSTALTCAEQIGTKLLQLGYSLPQIDDPVGFDAAAIRSGGDCPRSCLH